jgi:hypothetical protein
MIRDGGVDVDEVNLWILKDFVEIGVPLRDPKLIPGLVQFMLIAATYSGDIGIGMTLIDGNELGTKTETNHGDIELL